MTNTEIKDICSQTIFIPLIPISSCIINGIYAGMSDGYFYDVSIGILIGHYIDIYNNFKFPIGGIMGGLCVGIKHKGFNHIFKNMWFGWNFGISIIGSCLVMVWFSLLSDI